MNFYTSLPGTTFKALIVNISPGRVTIRIDGGSNFTARTLILPDARIGEESYFRVKSNDMQGLIQLEMIKGSPQERQDNIVQEALRSANIHAGEENIELGRALVENNLPVDAETLQKATFFRHAQSESEQSMERTLFLLQEGFPADASSLRALDAAIDPAQHLSVSLSKLYEAVTRLAESEMQRALAEILGPPERMYLALENMRKPLGSFYAEVSETVQRMQAQLSKADQSFRNIQASLSGIRENLSFIQQVTQHVKYFQIPFMRQGQPKQGELFIYGKKDALIALDTANLGRVEILTNKDGKRLNLKFSGETNEVLSKLRASSPHLAQILQAKGFQLTGFSFTKKDERTTVLSPNPTQQGLTKTAPSADNRRYSFDMRV